MNTKRKIMPGMLIRNLCNSNEIDVVLSTPSTEDLQGVLTVATKMNNGGVMQYLTLDAEVRWPWDPETAWVRVIY